MAGKKDELLGLIRDGQEIRFRQQLLLTVLLSLPAILAQLSSVLMQYIDTAMVGRLGSGPAASIGLVSTTTWIFGGFTMGCSSGFSVQIAHLCGNKDFAGAREVMRQGLRTVLLFSLALALAGVAIAGPLPRWLGGSDELLRDAGTYFAIYAAFIPVGAVGWAASMMLQASGNMKVPSLMYIGMCLLDVVFNYIFIYGFGMGVAGAAIGTGLSEAVTSAAALWYVLTRCEELRLRPDDRPATRQKTILKNAWGITGPLWLQNVIMRGAYIMSTLIVAPLGTVAIAANSFAIVAESFCYMPGYGIEEAATTLVGQCLGARRKGEARHFAGISISLAATVMTLLAVLMYLTAPWMMGLLSTDPEVIELGVKVLRIEAFAETMYAVGMVGYGCCVGAGDTLMPSALNFGSMWVVRIGLAAILTPRLGLQGYWIAMCVELNVRGLLFLWRLRGEKWMKKNFVTN